jgi:hypothetical protein
VGGRLGLGRSERCRLDHAFWRQGMYRRFVVDFIDRVTKVAE